MFDLSGAKTPVSRMAEAVARGVGLIQGQPGDSLALVLYRTDPFDQLKGFPFLTTMLGVTQPEPMFGPMVHDDRRRAGVGAAPPLKEVANPLGFKGRERTTWNEKYAGDRWELHLNGRHEKGHDRPDKSRVDLLVTSLRDLLEVPTQHSPLFPELWHNERLLSDKLRGRFRKLPPGATLDLVVQHLMDEISQSFNLLLKENHTYVGLYVRADGRFQLLGDSLTPWLPPEVHSSSGESNEDLNAFDWVHQSTRPVLIRHQISDVWRRRLEGCGDDFRNVIRDQSFAGCCLVPVLDLSDAARTLAVLLFQPVGPVAVNPAHVFLLSRAAQACSAYLTPLQAAPGFGLWNVGRGRAKVKWKGERPLFGQTFVEQLASELMPSESKVTVELIDPGKSGARVFRLQVHRGAIEEIPRILKLGDEEALEIELKAYYSFVNNTRVGGSSRLDIARRRQDLNGTKWGAAVYTLVGSGKAVEPWSSWGKKAPIGQIEQSLGQLHEQFSCWYDGTHSIPGSPVEILIRDPLVISKRVNSDGAKQLDSPTWDEVHSYLRDLCLALHDPRALGTTRTCVVHGDLHCGNVFALLESGSSVTNGVAVIDWGSVNEGEHPLTDVARLMADLLFRVRWSQPDWDTDWQWAVKMVGAWGRRNGLTNEMEWRLALIHQLVRFMFYVSENKSYLEAAARARAWEEIQQLGNACRQAHGVDGR
ncbi:MAG TPA: phosphotransferase [Vicinamibacterales bacterium]|nr:phosphotransferase [Vicinamibacterales bacterium]